MRRLAHLLSVLDIPQLIVLTFLQLSPPTVNFPSDVILVRHARVMLFMYELQ